MAAVTEIMDWHDLGFTVSLHIFQTVKMESKRKMKCKCCNMEAWWIHLQRTKYVNILVILIQLRVKF